MRTHIATAKGFSILELMVAISVLAVLLATGVPSFVQIIRNNRITRFSALEEPHGRTLIILITSQPTLLLATIRSRCQMLKFARCRKSIAASSRGGVNPRDAADAAMITEGSLGLSLRWLEDGVIDAARDLADGLDNLTVNPRPNCPTG